MNLWIKFFYLKIDENLFQEKAESRHRWDE